jgi:hypothetical protein
MPPESSITIVIVFVMKVTMAMAVNYIARGIFYNGKARFKNANNELKPNIYSYSETSCGQSSNLYLNVIHIFNTNVY